MEIGSEFWIESIPLISDELKINMPNWINKFGNYVLTSSGRGALSLLLQNIKPKVKSVLLPNYICESVITPFINNEYKIYYYSINKDLEPDLSSLPTSKDIGVFLHIGYFGFCTNYILKDVLKHYKNQGTIIVEDLTHTLFSNYERTNQNDYYIGSIRKWFGLPSGGILISTHNKINNNLSLNKQFSNMRETALLLKSSYIISGDEKLKIKYLQLFHDAEVCLDHDVEPYKIDSTSIKLISMLDDKELIKKRKENFNTILKNLKCSNNIEPIFYNLPFDVCPLFFPIFIQKDRDIIKNVLIDNKIYCPIHWPIPNILKSHSLNSSHYIFDHILSIPCDQRYTIDDMLRIVTILNSF